MSERQSLALPPVVDIAAVSELRGALLERTGDDLEVDAGAVERIGGLGIQLLLSAEKTWASNGRVLSIVRASPAFIAVHRLTDA